MRRSDNKPRQSNRANALRKLDREASKANTRTRRVNKINSRLQEEVKACSKCFPKGEAGGARINSITGNMASDVTLVYTPDLMEIIYAMDTGMMMGVLPPGADQFDLTYLGYILKLVRHATGYDLLDKCLGVPIIRCHGVKPTKVKVANCHDFFAPFRTKKFIVIGKPAASALLFDGYSPPDMKLLNGRPVHREGKDYIILHGKEFVDGVFEYVNPSDQQIANQMLTNFTAEVADRALEKFNEWFD